MTLNSIDWNDEIIYNKQVDNKTTMKEVIAIGNFIDNLMNEYKKDITIVDNNTETEYLDIQNLNITVPTVDENGKCTWELLEAITRHLPGHDGKLVKIKTEMGLEVSATKSKSFLVRKDNNLIEIDGDKIKIGDRLPIDIEYIDSIKMNTIDKNHIFNGVYMDKIVELNEVLPSHDKVYDLTVAKTRNFTMANGICMRDTFHSTGSGVAGMQGVPRLNELLNNTKSPNTPYMVIYFDEQHNKELFANHIGSLLKYTVLKDLVETVQYINDENPTDREDSYYNTDPIDKQSVFYLNNMSTTNINNMPFLFRMTLSKEAFVRNNVEMIDIKTKFVQFWEILVDASSSKKKTKMNVSNILHGCIMTSLDNADELIIHFRFELQNAQLSIQQELVKSLLEKLNIKGNEKVKKIEKIDNQQVIKYDEDGKIDDSKKEWVIYTDGIDMNYVRDLVGVDLKRTYCNDINTIYKTFGIEAVRAALLKEFNDAFSGNEVNFAHLSMLVDAMTHNGKIISMNRFGINRLDTAPLGRITFEKTMEQLAMACAFNEKDNLNGVSSRVMVGRCIRGGTCMFDVELDIDIVQNSEIDDTKEIKMVDTTFKKIEPTNLLSEMRKHNVQGYMPELK